MFTLQELRLNWWFRIYYKTPYFIKNAFLMLALLFTLAVFYLMFMRPDGGSYESVMNIVKGLTSNTFNYLSTHNSALYIGNKNTPEYDFTKGEEPTTVKFFSDCVRLNRPCKLTGMALGWTAS